MQFMVDDMKISDSISYQKLGMIIKCLYVTLITCSGMRTISHKSWNDLFKMIPDKVLNKHSTFAYVSTIEHMNRWWLDCKECNWYKSEHTIVSKVRLYINIQSGIAFRRGTCTAFVLYCGHICVCMHLLSKNMIFNPFVPVSKNDFGRVFSLYRPHSTC